MTKHKNKNIMKTLKGTPVELLEAMKHGFVWVKAHPDDGSKSFKTFIPMTCLEGGATEAEKILGIVSTSEKEPIKIEAT